MKKKLFLLGILAIALIFGIMVLGCGESGNGESVDTWSNVTSLNQLNGTWKGSYNSGAQSLEDMEGITMTTVGEFTITINASAETASGTVKTTVTFSGANIALVWDVIKESMENGEGFSVDNEKHSISFTQDIPTESITGSIEEGLQSLQINQNGKKIKLPAGTIDEEVPEIIMVKQ
ncbi:MAG: hypothetical protein LBE74_01785 [Treponema sp.]|jgi:hypothetical protein|nr:hypothetical protein [Treponema sp.]